MPADAPPRWVTVRKPFDYPWPGRAAITSFKEADLGEHLLKAEVADFAVDGGYAVEGKLDGSARSRKGGKGKRVRAAKKKEPPAAATADSQPGAPVGDEDAADADRTADRPAVDSDAG
jgi:hypothetical protein